MGRSIIVRRFISLWVCVCVCASVYCSVRGAISRAGLPIAMKCCCCNQSINEKSLRHFVIYRCQIYFGNKSWTGHQFFSVLSFIWRCANSAIHCTKAHSGNQNVSREENNKRRPHPCSIEEKKESPYDWREKNILNCIKLIIWQLNFMNYVLQLLRLQLNKISLEHPCTGERARALCIALGHSMTPIWYYLLHIGHCECVRPYTLLWCPQ